MAELAEYAVIVPSRWAIMPLDHAGALRELDRLAGVLVEGAEALGGLYMRICDTMREHQLTDTEIRSVLERHFPPPRVSEFIRIARAPEEVYRRYRGGFVGFRAALAECRGYHVHGDGWLTQRKIRRAAERLVLLLGQGEVAVRGRRVIVV